MGLALGFQPSAPLSHVASGWLIDSSLRSSPTLGRVAPPEPAGLALVGLHQREDLGEIPSVAAPLIPLREHPSRRATGASALCGRSRCLPRGQHADRAKGSTAPQRHQATGERTRDSIQGATHLFAFGLTGGLAFKQQNVAGLPATFSRLIPCCRRGLAPLCWRGPHIDPSPGEPAGSDTSQRADTPAARYENRAHAGGSTARELPRYLAKILPLLFPPPCSSWGGAGS